MKVFISVSIWVQQRNFSITFQLHFEHFFKMELFDEWNEKEWKSILVQVFKKSAIKSTESGEVSSNDKVTSSSGQVYHLFKY